MKALHLSKDLKLPLDAVTQTFAILAMRGVGKTHTASVLAEELGEAALPFVVLDPTGAWWGLRASADGKGDGYPVTILGGDHGDVPLEEGGGKLIADLVAEKAPSLILDLSLLSKSAMRRFVADFAEQLYRKNRSPLHLIIDEADAFAPQRPRPDEMRMLGALDEIVRRGRIRGLGCTLVTQRSAVLNKDVLTQAEVLVVLRTAHPRDRAPVLEWMKVHATPEQLGAVEESLAKLPKGDAWVMSAGWLDLFKRVHIRERRTFNSSATPAPGQVRAAPRRLAPVDLKELEARMAETIERAKASDPAILRKRVAELERELAKPARIIPQSIPAPKRVEIPVLKDAQVKRLERVVEAAEGIASRLTTQAAALRQVAGEVVASVRQIHAPAAAAPRPPAQVHRVSGPGGPSFRQVHTGRPPPAGSNGHDPDAQVGNSGLRRMLIALAQRPQGLTNQQLGVRAGVSSRSGTFSTYLGRARTNGWVEGRGHLVITEAGLAALGTYQPLPEGRDLATYWINQLGGGAARMLQVLVEAYPRKLTNTELGEAAQISAASGTFSTYLGRLRALELVTGRGELRASEELAP